MLIWGCSFNAVPVFSTVQWFCWSVSRGKNIAHLNLRKRPISFWIFWLWFLRARNHQEDLQQNQNRPCFSLVRRKKYNYCIFPVPVMVEERGLLGYAFLIYVLLLIVLLYSLTSLQAACIYRQICNINSLLPYFLQIPVLPQAIYEYILIIMFVAFQLLNAEYTFCTAYC